MLKMAGNLTKQKKSFLSQASELLPQMGSKTQHSEKNSEPQKGTKNNTFVNYSNATDNFDTWPSVKLHTTVEEAVYRLINGDPPKSISNIIDEVKNELEKAFPVEIEEQFDFCMMCSEVDHIEAVELQTHLCSEYDLVGKVLWECVPLGRDVFSVIEDMLNNSTKLLYYVTDRFDDTDACAHVAKTLLVEQDNEGSNRKLIPLVSNFDIPIPETFLLVDKLYLCNKLQFQYRFSAVFTEVLKFEKVTRTEKLKRRLDEKRKIALQNLVRSKLGL